MNHSRYLFDIDFSTRHLDSENLDEPKDPTLNETNQSAYERGYAAGRLDRESEQNSIAAGYVLEIVKSIEDVRRDSKIRKTEIEAQVLIAIKDLARQFAADLRPGDILTKPEFGFAKILNSLEKHTNLVLSVSVNEFDHFQKLTTESGLFPTPLIVAEESRRDGNFELTWDNGGVQFDNASLQNTISNMADNYSGAAPKSDG